MIENNELYKQRPYQTGHVQANQLMDMTEQSFDNDTVAKSEFCNGFTKTIVERILYSKQGQ